VASLLYDKPFVAVACDTGVRQESQPITLDAGCEIVSVLHVRFVGIFMLRKRKRTQMTDGKPDGAPDQTDMQVRRYFLFVRIVMLPTLAALED
jgi:hypothetical protein